MRHKLAIKLTASTPTQRLYTRILIEFPNHAKYTPEKAIYFPLATEKQTTFSRLLEKPLFHYQNYLIRKKEKEKREPKKKREERGKKEKESEGSHAGGA